MTMPIIPPPRSLTRRQKTNRATLAILGLALTSFLALMAIGFLAGPQHPHPVASGSLMAPSDTPTPTPTLTTPSPSPTPVLAPSHAPSHTPTHHRIAHAPVRHAVVHPTRHRVRHPTHRPAPARVVHPGAFCSPAGAHGVTSAGTPMTCRGPGQPRWRSS